MTQQEFKEILHKKETDTVEFKPWVNVRNMKEIISLAVDELIAFANSKGGTVYFGVEDNPVVVTGCDRNYDGQRIIEGIYDRTISPLFTEISDFEYEGIACYCNISQSRWKDIYNYRWQMSETIGEKFKASIS